MQLTIDDEGIIKDGQITIAVVSPKGFIALNEIRVLRVETIQTIIDLAKSFCKGKAI